VGLLVRILLFVAGAIASWFVSKDSVNFISVQMAVGLLLFPAFVALLAFWPTDWIKKLCGHLKPWIPSRHEQPGNTNRRHD